jgi:HEAT repeat protein
MEALDDPSSVVRLVAVRAIAVLGPKADAAVRALANTCSDPQPEVQFEAILALDRVGPGRKAAVPALITVLDDNSARARLGGARATEAAVLILGKIGPEAQAAVPSLTNLLASPNPRLRQRSALALWRINRDRSVIPRLASELAQANDYQTCSMIITSLGEIGPAAKEALPIILDKANQGNVPGDRYALRSLKNVARRAVGKIDRVTAEQMVRPDAYVPDLRNGALLDATTAEDLGLNSLAP